MLFCEDIWKYLKTFLFDYEALEFLRNYNFIVNTYAEPFTLAGLFENFHKLLQKLVKRGMGMSINNFLQNEISVNYRTTKFFKNIKLFTVCTKRLKIYSVSQLKDYKNDPLVMEYLEPIIYFSPDKMSFAEANALYKFRAELFCCNIVWFLMKPEACKFQVDPDQRKITEFFQEL